MIRCLPLTLALILVAVPGFAQDAGDVDFSADFKKAAKKVQPFLTRLGPFKQAQAGPKNPFAPPRPRMPGRPPAAPETWTSAGIIVADDYILTSFQGIGGQLAGIPVVTAAGKSLMGGVVGTDEWRDLALIKCAGVKLPGKLPLANTKSLDVGSFALAIGRAPRGRGLSIHAGILSATSRFRRKLLQSDARSHKGVWGGCMVNLDGQILGLITVGSSRPKEGAGVTFALRAEHFAANIQALKKGQRVPQPKPGFLGVYLDAKKSPLTVTRCVKGSPAEKAGIKAGDQILDIGGLRVNEPKVLKMVLGRLSEGETVSVLIVRAEKRLRLKKIVLSAAGAK